MLDGYHRLDAALELQQERTQQDWPILLITCPNTSQPTRAQLQKSAGSLQVLLEGTDTVEQAAAFARYIARISYHYRPRSIRLISDSHHFPRASWAFQIAAGSLGVSVHAHSVSLARNTDNPEKYWLALRDLFRAQLWRLAATTGSFLDSGYNEQKTESCFGA